MAVSMDDDVPLILTLDDSGSSASAPLDELDREELPNESKSALSLPARGLSPWGGRWSRWEWRSWARCRGCPVTAGPAAAARFIAHSSLWHRGAARVLPVLFLPHSFVVSPMTLRPFLRVVLPLVLSHCSYLMSFPSTINICAL